MFRAALRSLRYLASAALPLVLASFAQAQYWSSAIWYPLPTAPHTGNTAGSFFFLPNGQVHGPVYFLHPGAPVPMPVQQAPVNQMMFQKMIEAYNRPVGGGGPAMVGAPEREFPTHPWARSPRDFFMYREVLQDALERERRPGLVP